MKKIVLLLFFISSLVQASQVYVLDMYFDRDDLLNTPVAKRYEDQLHGSKVVSIIKNVNPDVDYELRSTINLARMIKSIRMIPGNRRTVVNISLWLDSEFNNNCNIVLQRTIDEAIERGVIFIVSAGNDSKDIIEHSPANCKNVITVGSQRNGKIRPFSNYGDDVFVFVPEGYYKGSMLSGTSFSAPVITGLVSKWLDENPSLTLDDIKAKLRIISDENRMINFTY